MTHRTPPGQVDLLTERPVVTVAVVVMVVVALVVLYVSYRFVQWLRRPQSVRFVETIEGLTTVDVLMHPNPDPDAMSSAIGIAAIARSVGVEPTLWYPGGIRHQENRAFRTVLDLELNHLETVEVLDGDEVILVDHNEPRGIPRAASIEPVAVIDHHPGEGVGSEHTDIRTEYGACASIVTEYLDDLGATVLAPGEEAPSEEFTLDSELVTGLVYGIHSDTDRLVSGACEGDVLACGFLLPGVDEEVLGRIANPQVDAETLEVKAQAIDRREVDAPYAVSNAGEVGNVDAIPQSADELARLEGVTAVVVFGEVDGMIYLSGRSRDDRVHMGNALSAAVEEIPMADAGGHARMGGGQVPREHMEGLGPQTGVGKPRLKARLFEAMRGEL